MRRRLSLISTIIISIILGFIILGSVTGYVIFFRSNKHSLLQAYEYLDSITRLISQDVSSLLEEKIRLLTLTREEFFDGSISENLLENLSNLFDRGIMYIDENGIVKKAYSRYEFELMGKDVSNREYFIQTRKTLKPYVSEGFKAITGRDVMVITVPVIKNNSFKGLIAGCTDLRNQKIGYLISSSRFYKTGRITVIDYKGTVLFSEDPTEIGKIFTQFPLYRAGHREIKINGKDYIVEVKSIPDTRWMIVASIEKEDILNYSYQNLRFGVMLFIPIFIAILILLILLLRKLLSYLKILRDISIEYAKGNYSKDIHTSPFREINDIIDALQVMGREIREREEKIKEEQSYLSTLLLEMGEGVFILNQDKKFEFVNERLTEMLGYTKDEITRFNPIEIFAPGYRERISKIYSEGERHRERAELVSKDGRSIPVLCSVSPINLNSSITGYLSVVTDLTEIEEREKELQSALEEIKALNEELTTRSQQLEIALARLDMKLFEVERAKENAEKLAIIDPLTGLFNRRYLEEKFSNELIKAKAYNSYVSVVMADIDHFKRINDTYGHKVGDEVLKNLALIFRANIREDDTVARYGGEEFVIILHNVDKYNAYEIAERIRGEIEETSFEEIGIPEKVTVSFGISSFPEDGEELTDLLIKADQALYQAKSLGRNRVEVYTKPSESIHF